MNIGYVIRKRRKQLNLTQEELAGKIKVSRTAISNWEQERNYPDLNMLLLLSDELNLSLDTLLRSDKKMVNELSLDLKKKKKFKIIIYILITIVIIFSFLTISIWSNMITYFSPNELVIEKIKKIEQPAQTVDGVRIGKDYKYNIYVKSKALLKNYDSAADGQSGLMMVKVK